MAQNTWREIWRGEGAGRRELEVYSFVYSVVTTELVFASHGMG
jgi:hypothetical protein